MTDSKLNSFTLITLSVCFLLFGPGSSAQSGGTEDLQATSPLTPIEDKPTSDLTSANLKTETRKSDKKELNNKPIATNAPEESVVYRLNDEDGRTCILLRVDAIISFTYTTKLNQRQESSLFISKSATVTGDCRGDDQQTLILKWKSFVLIWKFDKTPGGERWYVEEIELKYDSTDHAFEHIKDPGRTYSLSTSNSHNQLLFPTPVGKSYWCDREIDVQLDNPKVTDTVATILLRDLKIEPFLFKNNEFGPEFKCSAVGAGSYRSETAPLVVGSTLAAACLLTIAGYAVFRYFKIKKVQYDTME